jgi:hypothetical protein
MLQSTRSEYLYYTVSCQTQMVILSYCHLPHTVHSIFLSHSCLLRRKKQTG